MLFNIHDPSWRTQLICNVFRPQSTKLLSKQHLEARRIRNFSNTILWIRTNFNAQPQKLRLHTVTINTTCAAALVAAHRSWSRICLIESAPVPLTYSLRWVFWDVKFAVCFTLTLRPWKWRRYVPLELSFTRRCVPGYRIFLKSGAPAENVLGLCADGETNSW
jgi:hypothetical protein